MLRLSKGPQGFIPVHTPDGGTTVLVHANTVQKLKVLERKGITYRTKCQWGSKRSDKMAAKPSNGVIEGQLCASNEGIAYLYTPKGYIPLVYADGKTTRLTEIVPPPPTPAPAPARSQAPAAPVAPAVATAALEADLRRTSAERGIQWKEYSSGGRKYWANAATGETTWENPFAVAAAPAAAPVAAVQTGQWSMYTDPSSGKSYWSNSVTNETTWDNPYTRTPAPAPVAAAPAPQASEWTEHSAPNGRRYWANALTGQSTWEDPKAAPPWGGSPGGVPYAMVPPVGSGWNRPPAAYAPPSMGPPPSFAPGQAPQACAPSSGYGYPAQNAAPGAWGVPPQY